MKSPFFCGLYANASTQLFGTPLFNSLQKHLLSVGMLILMGTSISFAQTIELSNLTPTEKAALKDTVRLEAAGFGKAKPFTSAKKNLDAHYEYFWIFSNGNFIQNTRDSAVLQRFEVPSGSGGKLYTAHLYTTANYSDRGDIPPKISRDTTIPEGNPNPDPFRVTPAVTSGYLRLQYNHNNIVPNDTTVWVLSIKNPLKNNPINKFNGEVYLFFNSPVERISSDLTSDSQVFTPIQSSGKTQYAEFENIGSMVYFDSITQTFDMENIQDGLVIDSLYQNALFWHLDNMNGEEERHIFIEFKDDPNILDKFGDTERARVKFLAFLVVDNDNIQPALTDDEASLAQQLQINELINIAQEQLSQEIIDDIDPNTPTSFPQFQPGFLLADIYENEPEVAKAHDPNRMEIQACSCPPNSDGAQKLVCSVQFVNDGTIDANSIFIDIDIPEELEINSVFDTLVYLFPPIVAGELGTVSLNKGSSSIRWTLDGFAIHPDDPNAADDLASTGKITFTILTKPGVNLDDIPEMQACIRFNDETANAVCTLPVKPTPMVEDVKSESSQVLLQCDECDCPPFSIWNLPLWLLILILLVLLLIVWLIIFLRRQSQNSGTGGGSPL